MVERGKEKIERRNKNEVATPALQACTETDGEGRACGTLTSPFTLPSFNEGDLGGWATISRIDETGRGLGNEGAEVELLGGVFGGFGGSGGDSVSSSSPCSPSPCLAGSGGGSGKSHGRGTLRERRRSVSDEKKNRKSAN